MSLLSCPIFSLLAEQAQGDNCGSPALLTPKQGTRGMDLGLWLARRTSCSMVICGRECIAMQ